MFSLKISSEELLNERASYLVQTYLDVDVLKDYPVPVQIRWVTNQNSRWGSCTPGDGNIRISHRIQGMPQYVIDAVLLHELIHLLVADHSPKFYSYLDKFTDYKLAKEYLAGYSFAQQNLFID
jgi:predicted metal-dependent hydrolase